jgi:hypothetical protein
MIYASICRLKPRFVSGRGELAGADGGQCTLALLLRPRFSHRMRIKHDPNALSATQA